MVVYGTPNDPGVEWRVIKRDDISIESLVPSARERASAGTWNGDYFPQSDFLCDTPLALHDLREYQGLAGMQVQITLLRDGGYAIGIRTAHVLADAQSLMVFVHQWAAANRATFGSEYTKSLMGAPIFDPALLDAHAAGDVDGPAPDPRLIAAAREPPPAPVRLVEDGRCGISEHNGAQYAELDAFSGGPGPVCYTQIHFSGDQLAGLKQRALAEGEARRDISRLDVLLGHLWMSINRARNLANCLDTVCMDLSIGARTRVSPLLPDTFLGSPLVLTHVGASGKSLCAASIGTIASQIRETLKYWDVCFTINHHKDFAQA